MVTMKRVMVAGATVSVAGLTALSSAWACVGGFPGGIILAQTSGLSGDSIRVDGRTFVSGSSPVQIRWDSTNGLLLAATPGEDTAAANKSFSVTITVPNDRAGIHFIVATQRSIDGGVIAQSIKPFEVLAPAPPPTETPTETPTPSAVDPTPAPTPESSSTTPVTPGVATLPAASEATPARQPTAGGPPAATPTGGPGGPPSRVTATPGQPSPSAGPADASVALAPNGAAAETQTPAPPVALPAKDIPPNVRDVWSGLDESNTFAPGASLTAPVPAPADDTPALAVGLLALGAMGLAAGAASLIRKERRTVTCDRG